MKATEPIRNKHQVRAIAAYYLKLGQIRNHVLINLGLYTALRISDILRLCWDDVYDFDKHRIRKRINIVEKKTGKAKSIALHSDIIAALELYAYAAKPGVPIILNERTGKAISRIQAYLLIRAAGEAVEIETRVSPHSLRKTFGYQSWKNGKRLPVIMKAYNHSSEAVTQYYLGITQDDIDELYLDLDYTG
jgi:integrase